MRIRVASARVGRLVTVAADGAPSAVPVCYALVGDIAYSAVDHKPKRGGGLRRLSNIEATGRACLLVDVYDEDWTRLWWVRLDCVGRLAGDPVETDIAVRALAAKYHQYAQRPPAGPVIGLEVIRWSGWSAA